MEPIIATQDLKKLYRLGRLEVPALRGVDLVVQEGEFLAVVDRRVAANPPCCTSWEV